jgi:hypothetical protein
MGKKEQNDQKCNFSKLKLGTHAYNQSSVSVYHSGRCEMHLHKEKGPLRLLPAAPCCDFSAY